MKTQIISLSLFAALIANADPTAGSLPAGGSMPVQTSPAEPMPVIPPGLNRMPGQNQNPRNNQNPYQPNSPNDFGANKTNDNPGVEAGGGFSAGNTNATMVQPGSRGRFENGQPFITNSMPGQHFRTNRQYNNEQRWMINRPSSLTNRAGSFTNRSMPFTNRPTSLGSPPAPPTRVRVVLIQ